MFVKNTSSWVVNIDKRSLLASEENNVIWERQNIFFLWGLSDSNNIAIVYMQFIYKDFSLKIYRWQQQPPEGCSSSFVRLTLQYFVKISRALTCFAASSYAKYCPQEHHSGKLYSSGRILHWPSPVTLVFFVQYKVTWGKHKILPEPSFTHNCLLHFSNYPPPFFIFK